VDDNSRAFAVIVPVYNGATHLQAALDSVAVQTFTDWECLIVDDGSGDESPRIAADWVASHPGRARLLRHRGGENRGVAATRNLALAEARAPVVAFLDQDDRWAPEKLERQQRYLAAHPEVSAASCVPRLVYDGLEPIELIEEWAGWIRARAAGPGASALGLDDFLVNCPFCLSGVVASREALLARGGFDVGLRGTSDWLMWGLLASQGPLGLQAETLVDYRVHGDNELLRIVRDPRAMIAAYFEMQIHLSRRLAVEQGMSIEAAFASLGERTRMVVAQGQRA
jgi:glycosyltransferase involved in cell wall biosynthesis